MSSRTKKMKKLAFLFGLLSILCAVAPACYYIIAALASNCLVIEKIAVVGSVFVAIIGSLISLLSKTFTFRSRIWIILLALYFAMESISNILIMFAVTQILDELILTPLYRHFKNKVIINKEIDLRGI